VGKAFILPSIKKYTGKPKRGYKKITNYDGKTSLSLKRKKQLSPKLRLWLNCIYM